jgi:Rps23 Pro-64 3,4-dihydroxylase Tpa1-like proline 4-hydroxylase
MLSTSSFDRAPPYGLVRNWLGGERAKRLLNYSQINQHSFRESKVGYEKGRHDPTKRRSSILRPLGDLRSELQAEVEALVPTMFAKLGASPFSPCEYEFELVAHGDGAFFSRHIDTATQNSSTSHRAISAVYYFHSLPKSFAGGVLRLHSLAASGKDGTFVDIEPDSDTLLFFPSLFPHEVLPVSCAGNQFMNSRFAINCLIHRKSR